MSVQQRQSRDISSRYWISVAVGIVLTLASGIVYGRLSQRWGPVADLRAAGEHLQTFPTHFGDWDLVEEKPIGETALQMLDCAGYVHRDYIERSTGQTISMFVIVGPPGPTAVHTPEICYSSRAFSILGGRRDVTLRDSDANSNTFWAVRFNSANDLVDQTLSVFYAWSDGTAWRASESPRFEFGGRKMLYKIQVAGLMADDATDKGSSSPSYRFLRDLLNSNWQTQGS